MFATDAVTDLGVEPRVPPGVRGAGRGRHGIWADGTLVGGVLFRTVDVEHGTAEVGCWLEPVAVGRGLVTRAVRLIIDWAVDERGIHRVEWRVSSANEAQHRRGPAARNAKGRRAPG
jgi:ribosomal-protein-serine acetyltransferase